MAELVLEVMGKPAAKGRPRFGNGRTWTDRKTLTQEAIWAAMAQQEMTVRKLRPFEGPISVYVRAAYPIGKSWSKAKREAALMGRIKPTSRPDLDNVVKLVLDGLNGVAFRDDSQVVLLMADKRFEPNPHVFVCIREMEHEPG